MTKIINTVDGVKVNLKRHQHKLYRGWLLPARRRGSHASQGAPQREVDDTLNLDTTSDNDSLKSQ